MSQYASVGIDTLLQREKIASIVILVTMAAYAVVLLGEVLELVGVIDLNAYNLSALATAYVVFSLVAVAIFIGSVIAVSMWIYRAHANLAENGIELETSPGWAVGWYFIPIANLFKPFQAMKELWMESHGASDSFAAPAPGSLGVWWGTWIIGNILGNVSTRLSLMGDGSNVEVALSLAIVSSILMIVCAWLLRQIISEITQAQVNGLNAAGVFG